MQNIQQIDYLNSDFTMFEQELDEMDKISAIKAHEIQINEHLNQALSEFENLKAQLPKEQSATLLELCKDNVINTITSQFGLASLFIDASDGGSVTTAHNFDKGITSNEADAKKYQEFRQNQNEKWEKVRGKVGYDEPLPQMRKEAFKSQDKIIDAYTGKELPKDGRAHLDHVVSAKEIESSSKNHLFSTPEERAKMATSEQNLAWTNASANQSKGAQKMDEWLDKKDKKSGKSNAERFEIDKDRARQKDEEARKFINKEINLKAVKKYSKELLQTGGKDAAKMAAYTAIGVIMRDLVQGIMIELRITFEKKGDETLKEMFNRFKARLGEILAQVKEKWKDIFTGSLEAGITAFLSNIVVFVINLFATTLKRFVAIIRAGFVSLVQAIKILANPPADMPQDEVSYQALKVLMAGLIGALSLGLTEAIEKLLLSVPLLGSIMSLPLPFGEQTVGDAIAVTMSALCGGLLTTIALYFMDKVQSEKKESRLQIQLMTKSGVIVHLKVAQTWCVLGNAYDEFFADARQNALELQQTKDEIEQSSRETSAAVSDSISKMQNLRDRLSKITKE
ncbi:MULTISPECIES: hypothetical protein [unclassified Campylobacter]|uniref:hypothetical protein n=1 Tax=unclassified Campylobacter TaxID=2593542 RepID=UPI003D350425